MLTLTFTGETIKDVLSQVAAAVLVLSAPADDAAQAKAVEATVVKTEKVEEKPSSEKLKADALAKLRRVFASGADGQKAVKALQTKYGVKKFDNIADEQIAALHADALAL